MKLFLSTKKVTDQWKALGVLCAVTIFLANRGGVPQAVTLAPGEPSGLSCNACHVKDKEFNPSVDLTVMNLDSTPVTAYEAGKKYIVKLKVGGSNGVKSYGFQMVSLVGNDNLDAGLWSNLGPKVKLFPKLQRQYLEQSAPSDNGEFFAQWTAPQSGDVKFYMAGLAINGNGNSNGDQVVNGIKLIPQKGVSSTLAEPSRRPIRYDFETKTIQIDEPSLVSSIKVYANSGQQMIHINMDNLSLCDIAPGIYYIVALDRNNKQITKPLVVSNL
jgi:hypothetical protein